MNCEKGINIKAEKINGLYAYDEDDVFSNSTLSDVEKSFKFWDGVNNCDIFNIYKEFEDIDDEEETQDKKEKFVTPKLQHSIETNTTGLDNEATAESSNVKTEKNNQSNPELN
ncbi:conserved Plasmodium protein, unknown function [Plasmodium berghei]|uniref:Uncharacterized protein n=2 Tax=Plasmodium berghei TaxID=5821 RepID=A0A509AUG6_PLABA|nr:conserved Plasmodium protein, unknown function [Plasmodium berghei ANKA]CXJ18959.1 conserved Plasmodium protein, unknown function [Plasmodium berghei]SCM26459.1 conserved Plasmodium protein, unknown function [Plasmodium berghei]SCN28469.1 conserved Plasmodium protein, unknown function [Plasmodium berghei]SCO62659.1 conserved Plasmodium protein, unknown function [Plasmodium berghei]SCO64220.1 conserved Plasmodium protein, unknown function [Plasmodium berghei]|eukprot:XP_034424115.1 conserved Plasmodium protein, unknown function [Plasmodium berghei ANKA]